MIQKHRSPHSKSFLRELEHALFLFEKPHVQESLLKKAKQVFENRKNPEVLHTGEKALKMEILAHLKRSGETQTANVWARGLKIEKKAIEELLLALQQELRRHKIQGVLEIHLQDREINSPHIQFVGNDVLRAEVVIAQILVDKKYENSLESALSKKHFVPYYQENNKATISHLKPQIEFMEDYALENLTQNIQKSLDSFKAMLQNFDFKRKKRLFKRRRRRYRRLKL